MKKTTQLYILISKESLDPRDNRSAHVWPGRGASMGASKNSDNLLSRNIQDKWFGCSGNITRGKKTLCAGFVDHRYGVVVYLSGMPQLVGCQDLDADLVLAGNVTGIVHI